MPDGREMRARVARVYEAVARVNEVPLRLRGTEIGHGTFIGFGVEIRAPRVRIGSGTVIRQGTRILCREEVSIGENCRLYGGISVKGARRFEIGEYGVIHPGLRVEGPDELVLGDNCWVGREVHVNVQREVRIGHNVGLGPETMLWTHGFFAEAVDGYPSRVGRILIEDDAWLAARITVLPGVRIGTHAIVSAAAVVTRDLEPRHTYAGVPAKAVADESQYRRELPPDERVELVRSTFLARTDSVTLERDGGDALLLRLDGERVGFVAAPTPFDPVRHAGVRARWPGVPLLWLCVGGADAAPDVTDPQLSVFDLETKRYRHAGTRAERAFKESLHDHVARFRRAPELSPPAV